MEDIIKGRLVLRNTDFAIAWCATLVSLEQVNSTEFQKDVRSEVSVIREETHATLREMREVLHCTMWGMEVFVRGGLPLASLPIGCFRIYSYIGIGFLEVSRGVLELPVASGDFWRLLEAS